MDAAERAMAIRANQLGIDFNTEFLVVPEGVKPPVYSTGPLFIVMALARKDATIALAALAHVDPDGGAGVIRKLQNEVQRYFDMVEYVRKILEAADEAHERLTEDDAEELRAHMAQEGVEQG